MATCPQSITPTFTEDLCNGEHSSTDCVLYPNALTYLGLSPNSTMTEVVQALLLSLTDARNRIIELESQNADFEIRITALENA